MYGGLIAALYEHFNHDCYLLTIFNHDCYLLTIVVLVFISVVQFFLNFYNSVI